MTTGLNEDIPILSEPSAVAGGEYTPSPEALRDLPAPYNPDRPLRVLFVEDSPDDAALMLRVLQRAGYQVVWHRVDTAGAMREALGGGAGAWDVVLTDYSMPRFSAPRALELLQSSGCDIPMIVVSGSVGEETAVAVMKSGAADYLMKDSLARLVPAVEREIRDAAIRRERLRNQQRIHRQVAHLAALRVVDAAIGRGAGLAETLNVMLDQLIGQLDVDAACVLLHDVAEKRLRFAAGRGFRNDVTDWDDVPLGQGLAGISALERRRIPETGVLAYPDNGLETERLRGMMEAEGFSTYVAEPLIAKNQVLGVLEVFHRRAFEPDDDWLKLLDAMAAQAAIGIDQASMFDELQRRNAELVQAYDTTLEGWSRALDLRDKETEGHTRRVTEMTVRLCRRLGLDAFDIEHIRRGALLHDIGKMGIPDAILLKPGPLTDEEWVIMRKHPEYARDLLSPIEFLQQSMDIPYSHHEKWDGSGYPLGLKGEDIPLGARAFAIVDVYDALRSDRPYRKGWDMESTLTHIRKGSGSHFDSRVVDAFDVMMREETPPA